MSVESMTNKVSFESLDDTCLEDLKKWITEQRTIPFISDETLKMFLHSCYYDVEATKTTLIAYYSLRTKSLELFVNRDHAAKEIVNASLQVYCVLLPGTTPEGYKVCIAGKLRSDNVKEYVFKDVIKFILMAMDVFVQEFSDCSGFIIIAELNNYTFAHARKFDIQTIKTFVTYFQDAFPIRLKKILLLNMSTVGTFILNMVFPFMNETIRSLIEKYTEGDTRYFDIVSQSLLPVEYGGQDVTLSQLQDETMERLKKFQPWFTKDDEVIKSLSEQQNEQRQNEQSRRKSFLSIRF